MKQYIAEAVGTAMLVMGGCGAAIFAAKSMGTLGVALAFGLSLILVAYTVGQISGGHVNPAVTIGLTLAGKFPRNKLVPYVVAQVAGGLLGGAIMWFIGTDMGIDPVKSGFAANVLGTGVGIMAGFTLEVFMTALLVIAALFTTRKAMAAGFNGILMGATLALVHIVSIPVTNTSVNPARSIAVAPFAGGVALDQLWLFIVAPIIGAIVAAIVYMWVTPEHEDSSIA